MRNVFARVSAGVAAAGAAVAAYVHQAQGYNEVANVLDAVLFVDSPTHMAQIEAVWLSISWILFLFTIVMALAAAAPVGMRAASAVAALVFAGMGGAFVALSMARLGAPFALPQPTLLLPVALAAALAALLPQSDDPAHLPPLELSPG